MPTLVQNLGDISVTRTESTAATSVSNKTMLVAACGNLKVPSSVKPPDGIETSLSFPSHLSSLFRKSTLPPDRASRGRELAINVFFATRVPENGWHLACKNLRTRRRTTMSSKKTVKDPVCGMNIKPKEVQQRSDYQGSTYYFCSSTCKSQFDSQPDKYARPQAA